LLRNDFEVWVGKTGEKEVDFIAQKKGERMYIQVAYILQDEKTIQREFGNLAYIQDQYPKFVISMDEFSALHSWKGIRRLHLREFLSMEINDVFSI
jgi:predicted AAA+ superfamily ATPase